MSVLAYGRRKDRRSARVRLYRCALVVGVVILLSSCAGKSINPSAPLSQGTNPASTLPPSTSTGVSSDGRASTSTSDTSGDSPSSWSLVIEPNDGMQPIYGLMSSARHELDMTMYELADAQAVDILESDAARGVIVRVILDEDYSGGSVNASSYEELTSHGVQVHWAPADTIFHQKTITVDDQTSAIMTLNMTSAYYASSRDFAVITDDHPDVAAVEQVFVADWSNSGPPQSGPMGTNLVWSPGAEPQILAVIESAKHSLLVENEEMDDPDIAAALEASARRGVDVQVVMTFSSSWVAEFNDLVAAGVKVSTYSSDAPLYIHAKVVVADATTAFVGSQNFSVASLDYNRELGIITTDQALVVPMARTVMSDFVGGARYSSGGPAVSVPPLTSTSTSGVAWCNATASPANDGYSGDYDVYVHSNQPGQKATASDSGDTYSDYTNDSGYVVIRLWNTSAGEAIKVTVGGASCSAAA
jgi:cardiolipin synthase A/B